MGKIIIEVKGKNDEELILSIAKKMRLKATKEETKAPPHKSTAEAMKWMEKIANSGGIDIKDPVKWQRSIRKDRKIR